MERRLVFIVEGDSEVVFVNNKVIPYLYEHIRGGDLWLMHPQKILTNRKKNISGGNISYDRLKNDIERTNSQYRGNVTITTLLDFYRLPGDFPGYSSGNIDFIEEAIAKDNPDINLIPYIQKFEFETLLFSDENALMSVIDDKRKRSEVDSILCEFPNIEDIDGGTDTAPSKRLSKIFNYDKVIDSEEVLRQVNLEDIIAKCPRFGRWMKKLSSVVSYL